MPDIKDIIDNVDTDLLPGDVTEALDKIKDIMDQNPAVKTLITSSFSKLQELIQEARQPENVKKPRTADEIRAAAQGAIGNIAESQTSLEKFIEWGLTTSEDVIGLIAELLGAED